MRLAPAALVVLAGSLASAIATAGEPGAPISVLGGSDAKAGAWPDIAAILFPTASGDEALCTGTLIAPTIVLTAGHCYDPGDPPLPDNVLIGASSLAHPGDGETIAIKHGYVYPNPVTTEDLAVLVLAKASSRKPRQIADGWARLDLVNGAEISLVGFGAVNRDGTQFVDELQEARSTITDVDCSMSPGCNADARPAGELGAGGMGVDTCPGDSGGPLYLMAPYGPVLAGVTSRSYDNPAFPCFGGGIYVRPDKVLDWIEQKAGVSIARVGTPKTDPLVAVHGAGDDVRIQVNDPRQGAHLFEITTPPAHAMAKVRSDGAVRVCIDPDAAPGDDQLTVKITDFFHDERTMPLTIPIHIQDGTPPASCDINAFSESGGCRVAGEPSAIGVALAALGLVRRRRRS
jgi:endonuclease G